MCEQLVSRYTKFLAGVYYFGKSTLDRLKYCKILTMHLKKKNFHEINVEYAWVAILVTIVIDSSIMYDAPDVYSYIKRCKKEFQLWKVVKISHCDDKQMERKMLIEKIWLANLHV